MPATMPAPSRPRPPLTHDHASLFREAAYEDGQPYARHDDLEDDAVETG